MPNLRAIQQELLDSESIKLVTASLGEVAAFRLKSTKESIVHNSEFFKEIMEVYRTVEAVGVSSGVLKELQKEKIDATVSVLLTSNAHFYGGLDRELSDFFMENVKKYAGEKVVVGLSGVKTLTELGLNPFKSIIFKQDLPNPEELKALIDSIRNYRRVLVYYSKFATLLDQRPEVADLSAEEGQTQVKDKPQSGYILEPEVKKMLQFFDQQILTALFNSIFLGANLSRIAARMVAMDSAEQNAQKEIDREKMEFLKAQKYLKNIQILENFVSISIKI